VKKEQRILNEEERETLNRIYGTLKKSLGASGIFTLIEIVLSGFLIYVIRELFVSSQEVSTGGSDADTLIVVLLLLILFVVMIVLIKFTIQMFFQNLPRYRAFRQDKIENEIQIIRGRMIEGIVRKQGLTLVFENQCKIDVDFENLVVSGSRITDCVLLTNTEVEVWKLPHSNLAYKIKFPEFSAQFIEKYGDEKTQKWIRGTVTLAYSYRMGHGRRYRGASLDPTKLIVQVGNSKTTLPFGYTMLPQAGTYGAYPFDSPQKV